MSKRLYRKLQGRTTANLIAKACAVALQLALAANVFLPVYALGGKRVNERAPQTGAEKKMSVELQALVGQGEGKTLKRRVIVQTVEPPTAELKKNLRLTGADFKAFNGFTAEVDADALNELALSDDVLWISPDRQTRSTAIEDAQSVNDLMLAATGKVELGKRDATLSGAGIGIAVLDTGVDAQALAGEKAPTSSISAPSSNLETDSQRSRVVASVNFVGGEETVADLNGHGTVVASLAAGANGIAPGANVINVRVLDSKGAGTTSDAVRGVEWTIQNRARYGIRVVNISLGANSTESFINDPLCRAVERAVAAGLAVVTSAGNRGADEQGRAIYGSITSPGNDPLAITVGAVNMRSTPARSDDTVTNFSARGPARGARIDPATGDRVYDSVIKPDLVAPGNRLVGVMPANDSYLAGEHPELQVAPGLMQLSGTSMSAAIVSGAVALILQRNPDLPAPMARAVLQWSAQPIAATSIFAQGAGLLNIDAAVNLAGAIGRNAANSAVGAPLLAGTLPASVTRIGEEEVRLSRMITAGGTHAFGGDELFRSMQLVYQPEILWYANRLYRAGSLVEVQRGLARRDAKLVFTPGVLLLDEVVRANGETLDGDLTISGRLLAQGITVSEGITISEGITVSEGVTVSEGITVSEGVTVSESVAAGGSLNAAARHGEP